MTGIKAPFQNGITISHDIEQMIFRNAMIHEQLIEYRKQQLRENFPVKSSIIYCVSLMILAAAVFSIQIVMFIYKTNLYYVSAGFWVAGFYLLSAVIVLLLSITRNYKLYSATIFVNIIGLFVSVGGLVVVSIMGYSANSYYDFLNNSDSLNNMRSLFIPMIVIGFIYIFMFIVFSNVLACSFRRAPYSYRRQFFKELIQQPNISVIP